MFVTIQFLENSLKMGSYKKTQWVNKIKNKKFDVLFLGNSRVQNSIDVKSLTTVSEQSILNLGIDNSGIVEFNLMLNLFLDNNNSGEHLIIELDQGVLNEIEGKSRHLFTPFIKKNLSVNYFSNYINYFKFNFDLGILNAGLSLLRPDYSPYDIYGGALINRTYTDLSRKACYEYNVKLPEELEALINLARTKFDKITIITAPYFSINLNCKDKRENFKNIMIQNHLEYIDFTEVFLGEKRYFFDNRHLNSTGAKMFNNYLVDVIK
jgi:hypothetical protein